MHVPGVCLSRKTAYGDTASDLEAKPGSGLEKTPHHEQRIYLGINFADSRRDDVVGYEGLSPLQFRAVDYLDVQAISILARHELGHRRQVCLVFDKNHAAARLELKVGIELFRQALVNLEATEGHLQKNAGFL